MTCDCDYFDFGDEVRNRQNPRLTGVVIGDRNWGSEYLVRLADGASTIWWHGFEIEHDGDDTPPAKEDMPDNVIPVDFTKGRAMTAETTTEGAA